MAKRVPAEEAFPPHQIAREVPRASLFRLPGRSSGAFVRPAVLARLYDVARRRTSWSAPPLHVFRTPEDEPVHAPEVEQILVLLFERALVRAGRGGADAGSVGVRIDVEEGSAGGRDVVVRIYDTGPIADPAALAPLPAFLGAASLRREPPAGPWTGVVALRIPARRG